MHINKTMDRADLSCGSAQEFTWQINELIRRVYAKGHYMTSWYGGLPNKQPVGVQIGARNRGPDYQPLLGAADDDRIPWYLYWEIYWILTNGPALDRRLVVLDAGGASSLFSCYLGFLGYNVCSIDISVALAANGNRIADAMGWKMRSYAMDMAQLGFTDACFDHAFSICVFEHLTSEKKQCALSEIARCLKPKGILSVTFDYRNPMPYVVGRGPDCSAENQISNDADLSRMFLSTGHFEIIGNKEFADNHKSYLVHPRCNDRPYTFGALFLRRKD